MYFIYDHKSESIYYKKKYFNTKERQRSAINVERFIFALYLPKVNICILSLPSPNQARLPPPLHFARRRHRNMCIAKKGAEKVEFLGNSRV